MYLPYTKQQAERNSDYMVNIIEQLVAKKHDIFLRI